MRHLSEAALTAALDVILESRGRGREADFIRERAPGLTDEECAEALRRAEAMSAAAYDLAARWFESTSWPADDDLERAHPGFSADDYGRTVSMNMIWARR